MDESIDEVFGFCRAFEKCVFYHAFPSRDPRTAEPQLVALVFEMLRRMQSRNIAIRSALSVISQCKQSLTTDVGLVRGFWRQVLNAGNCASVVVEIFESPEETRTCYKSSSVWTNEELRQRMARACTRTHCSLLTCGILLRLIVACDCVRLGMWMQLRIAHKVETFRWNLMVDSFSLNELPVYLRDVIELSQPEAQRRRLLPGSPRQQQQQQAQPPSPVSLQAFASSVKLRRKRVS